MQDPQPARRRRTLLQSVWYGLFRLLGWRGEYQAPSGCKFIIVVAPHTSNLDFVIGFIFSRAYALPFSNFLVKDSFFRGGMGRITRWLGGIPVNRREQTQFVDRVASEFARRPQMVLAITPEGTRSRSEYWKSGFYHIAQRADVPVILASIDYAHKYIACGRVAPITGDMEADLARIRAYYAGVTGYHPERQGEIRFRPRSDTLPPTG